MIPLKYGVPDETQSALNIVYPNPSNGKINVIVPKSGVNSYLFSLYDLTGRLLQSGTLNGGGENSVVHLDFTQFQKGVYLLRLSNGSTNYESKVVIQ